MADERTWHVDVLSRVEGEGRFTLRVRDGRVEEARLTIFEAPRFFEAFLRGRSLYEVPDLVARICGICPVAYQMSASRALEGALGVAPTTPIQDLRRLMYCGEWIESHGLHVFMLHAPDFLGYGSAVEMAKDHREVVERGLRIKKLGNRIVELLGGRAIHPVSVRVGGFTRAPTRRQLRALRAELEPGLDDALEATRWAASLPCPEGDADYTFVALGGHAYPLEAGDEVLISGRDPVPLDRWEEVFVETQAPWSNALQCHLADGTPYLCGPLARWHHHSHHVHPVAARAAADAGLPASVTNPYRSLVVRCVEIVHAYAEAIDICDRYTGASPAYVEPERHPPGGAGFGATEAPRGLLWHRYDLHADGTIAHARIVPPTSQNQARIEADLVGLAPRLLALDHDDATMLCEQLIRSYDPCISCSAHFLELDIQREDG